MEDKRIIKLRGKLKYLEASEIEKEIKANRDKLKTDKEIDKIAKEIYHKRGINYQKINNNIFNNFMYEIKQFVNIYKEKNKKIRRLMIFDLIYMIVLILIKVPFILVKDISYEYIALLISNNIISKIWDLIFLIIYTITIICIFIVLMNNFNNKYIINKEI